jgi:hypothetical protein
MGKLKNADGGKDLSTPSKKLKKNGVSNINNQLVEESLREMKNTHQKSGGDISSQSTKPSVDETVISKKKSKKLKEGTMFIFIVTLCFPWSQTMVPSLYFLQISMLW